MNELEIVTLIGSSLVGFIAPAFIEGSILQKTVTAIAVGLLYAVTIMIIKY